MEPPARVVVTSGHMIDAPGRRSPRFPSAAEPKVAAAIEAIFERWSVGPDDVVFSGAARGADVLFAESAARRGARVQLLLALPPDEFERTSVALADSIWVERYRDLLCRHGFEVLPSDDPAADRGGPEAALDVFSRTNRWMIERALHLAPPAALLVALVWDEQPAGGPGGTGDFAALAHRLRAPLEVVNPTRVLPRV
jgi:hypothetical protein